METSQKRQTKKIIKKEGWQAGGVASEAEAEAEAKRAEDGARQASEKPSVARLASVASVRAKGSRAKVEASEAKVEARLSEFRGMVGGKFCERCPLWVAEQK